MNQQRELATDEIAEGSRGTIRRQRVVDNLEQLDLPLPERHAAMLLRQAWEHVRAGLPLGPVPWGREEARTASGGRLWAAEGALSAADTLRRGLDAVGHHAMDHGVIPWVVFAGLSLASYERARGWRTHGKARVELLDALERLSDAYGT